NPIARSKFKKTRRKSGFFVPGILRCNALLQSDTFPSSRAMVERSGDKQGMAVFATLLKNKELRHLPW
ncbi:MAG: hypothetical protein KDJ29_06945, partial [Hyphomicrobiales bacterium]|nr:hypothetical protein [Hyphomicrobiales bacterium]